MPKRKKQETVKPSIPMPRKLVIAPEEPPAPPKQSVEPASPARRFVRVSAELKQGAEALLNAMNVLPPEDVEAAGIEALGMKHESEGSATQTAAAVHELLRELHPRGFPQTSGTKVEARGVIVDVPAELVWKSFWGEALKDAADTDHEHVEVEASEILLASKFAAAFRPENIVRVELLSKGEAEDRARVHEKLVSEGASVSAGEEAGGGRNSGLLKRFDMVRKCQAAFAKVLAGAVVPKTALRIAVTGESLGGLLVEVNGQQHQFGSKRAGLRGLLILALLRREDRFSVERFAKLYCGETKPKSSPGHTFNNAIAQLKEQIKEFDVVKHDAQRGVPGIVFLRVPSDDVLKALIVHLPLRGST